MSVKVSVCVPAYRAVAFLQESLDAVRAQTFSNWEITVVEDGSDDGTRELVEKFGREVFQPVRYLRHNQNRGLPAARNSAIEASDAAFVALLDSDDLWTQDHLESSVKALQNTGADLVCAASELFEHGSGKTVEVRMPSSAEIATMPISLYRRNFMQPSAVVMRRSACEQVGGFDESLESCEDLDYWFRLLRLGCSFAFTGEPTCRYRRHGTAMTSNAFRMAFSLAQVREKHFGWSAIPRGIRVRETASAFGSAGRIIRSKDPLVAASMFRRALGYEPWRFMWLLGIGACRLARGRVPS